MTDESKDDNIEFDKDGKPTDATMKYLFQFDQDKFLEFQNKYFTTKGTMGDNPFKGLLNKLMKGKKDGK
jgi:hypothetical protein